MVAEGAADRIAHLADVEGEGGVLEGRVHHPPLEEAQVPALLGSALAYGLFFWFANHGDLTSFTSLTFLTPVFALLCGVVLLEEQLQPLQWLGAALALVSVVLINRRALIWHPVLVEELP